MLDQASYTPRLKAEFRDRVRAAMKEEFGYKNDMQIPRLDKIVLNMGVGEAVKDTKKVKQAAEELSLIAGQKAVITHAKKSIAGFRVREEMPLGTKVTLRGDRMYEFLDRLINIAQHDPRQAQLAVIRARTPGQLAAIVQARRRRIARQFGKRQRRLEPLFHRAFLVVDDFVQSRALRGELRHHPLALLLTFDHGFLSHYQIPRAISC